jgi:hypothetical protein
MAFDARYPGVCASCGERIKVGDLIRSTDDGYVHEDCDDPMYLPVTRKVEVCTTCWLEKPCECDDD